MRSWTKIAGINEKSAFGLLSWFPDPQNVNRLFHIGGLDQSYPPRTSVEIYDEDSNSWDVYRQLPLEKGFRLPESPDYGCIAMKNDIIYSVGLTKIFSLDWNTWQVDQVILATLIHNKLTSPSPSHRPKSNPQIKKGKGELGLWAQGCL